MNYIITSTEYSNLVDKLAKRSIILPSLATTSSRNPSNSDDAVRAKRSREGIRLFLLSYSIISLVQGVQGLIRNRSARAFFKGWASISALRFGLFIASYSTSYKLLLSYLRGHLPASLARIGPALSALLATPLFLLESSQERRIGLALYAASSAIHSGWNAASKYPAMPVAMREGRWYFSPVIVFAASQAMLLHAFVYDPETFPQGMGNFILRYSSGYIPAKPIGSTLPWPTTRQITDSIGAASKLHYPSFSYLKPELDVSGPTLQHILPILRTSNVAHSRLVCAFLHPQEVSCSQVFLKFLSKEFVGAAGFFATLELVKSIIRWKKLLADPLSNLYRSTVSTLTSAAFVSSSIAGAWGSICFIASVLPGHILPTKRFYLQGFLSSLLVSLTSIGVKGYGRVTDLALYSARLAAQTAWKVSVKRGKVKNIKKGELIYFGLAAATLFSLVVMDPDSIPKGMVKSVLYKMAGKSTDATEKEIQKEGE